MENGEENTARFTFPILRVQFITLPCYALPFYALPFGSPLNVADLSPLNVADLSPLNTPGGCDHHVSPFSILHSPFSIFCMLRGGLDAIALSRVIRQVKVVESFHFAGYDNYGWIIQAAPWQASSAWKTRRV